MHSLTPWKKSLAGAFAVLVGAYAGCCNCPPAPILRPVMSWSPMRHHPCFRSGGGDALFGHHGTCWAPWPAEWIPCPIQHCETLTPQGNEFIPAPLSDGIEGVQGPLPDGEPLPPPVPGAQASLFQGGFSVPAGEIQTGFSEHVENAGFRAEASARRPLRDQSGFVQ